MKLLPLLLLCSTVLHAQLITEILSDPTPSHGLPEYEFLEIFNPYPHILPLKGYRLHYGQSTAIFPEFDLLPGTYAIVCRSNRVQDFTPYGPVIPLPNFSLPNAGALLLLVNAEGITVDEVHYREDWLRGREGYSLERIDLSQPCLQGTNWAPSLDPAGGSPGRPNTHIPPLEPPTTNLLARYWTDSTLTLHFSQPLLLPDHDVLLEGGELLSLSLSDPQTLHLIYRTGNEKKIILHLRSLKDCRGTLIPPQTLLFETYTPPDIGAVFISEIAYDAEFPDYVEIKAEVPVNLEGWTLSRLRGQVEERIVLSTHYLSPQTYTVFSADTAGILMAFPQAKNMVQVLPFLRLPADSATLVLRRPDGKTYDRVHYHTRLHAPLIPNKKGVALERSQFDPPVWYSSPTDRGYGSPGTENADPGGGDFGFWTEPKAFDPHTETTAIKYAFPFTGLQAQILLLDRYGGRVKTFSQDFTLGGKGEIPWDGTGDAGAVVPNGLYVFAIQVYGKELRRVFYTKILVFTP
jgi:hypothetical protein